MIRKEETICAVATGQGGAIAVIRVSGSQSLDICGKIFFPADKKIYLADHKGYSLIYGEILSGDEIIDEVLLSVFRAPHSYTGENSAEISCHASPFIQRKILELLINNGALAALPGEFTQRAFLNGKMDLSQAEAVADLIASSARLAHRVAISQMRGGFSHEIGKLRSELLQFASLIELELDFGEEDVEFVDRNELILIINRIKLLADNLASSFRIGNAIKNGIPVVIAGKPNSGKSTLLNALLKEERAIVSEIPGTTRDTIEDVLVIDGVEFRFIDTAGLRDTTDIIENLGIKKTHEKIDDASIVLLIDEATSLPASINVRAGIIRERMSGTGKSLMIIINKTDLADQKKIEYLKNEIHLAGTDKLLFISAREKTGLEELRLQLSEAAIKDNHTGEDIIISSLRHYEALKSVSESLERVLTGLETGIPDDLIATDIKQAIHYLGLISGQITTDEILGNIFTNFCIGK
jgi:tRNA modification GTPase